MANAYVGKSLVEAESALRRTDSRPEVNRERREENVLKITLFNSKPYDEESFKMIQDDYPELKLDFWENALSLKAASYIKDSDAVCAFVSDDVSAPVLEMLASKGVKLVLMRCAGYNNVDLEAASRVGITVMRVPGYSPEAVAEHAMALASAIARHLHKAYVKVRENNFSLIGLVGTNFHGKTAGIVGTGKIGAAMARICNGYGMKVLAYDVYQNPDLPFVTYVTLDELLNNSKYNRSI